MVNKCQDELKNIISSHGQLVPYRVSLYNLRCYIGSAKNPDARSLPLCRTEFLKLSEMHWVNRVFYTHY